jgi:hypothetical protein
MRRKLERGQDIGLSIEFGVADYIPLAITLAFDCAWGTALWLRWPEAVCKKNKDSWYMWYWLDCLSIPKTERNCVLFMRGTCIFGMVLVTLGGILSLFSIRH